MKSAGLNIGSYLEFHILHGVKQATLQLLDYPNLLYTTFSEAATHSGLKKMV